MADGRVWTTNNLDLRVDGSFCYGAMAENCESYGRLYTWPAATQACKALGEDWQLPTDQEWRLLARHYGGVSDESPDTGRTAFRELTQGGGSGFDAQLGGGRRPQEPAYARVDAHGFYWSATADGPGTAVYYNFAKGGPALHRQSEGDQDRAFSVRCIQVDR